MIMFVLYPCDTVEVSACILLFVLLYLLIVAQLRERQLFHSTFRLFMFSLSTQLIALIILSATYGKYANDGIDNYTAKTFGKNAMRGLLIDTVTEICAEITLT